MASERHQWRVVGRVPVSLVHLVCECGCGKRRVQIVGANGQAIGFDVPSFGGAIDGAGLAKVGAAVDFGRELVALWEKLRRAVA